MTIAPENLRITYTTDSEHMDLFHRYFDEALLKLKAEMGATHPLFIQGEAVESSEPLIEDICPFNTDLVLGRFSAATAEHVDQAVAAAKAGWASWRDTPWQARVAIIRKAALIIRQRKFEIGALMSLEVGKNRFESMGDAEESADLLDYYCDQMDKANGFITPMNNITAVETNTDVLRPYGVFACIAPFNFPAALAFGMSSAALVAGNTVVFKPATDTPWTGLKIYEVYRDAGVPAGAFHFLSGLGRSMGDALIYHRDVDGVVFTGSKGVGMHIFRNFSEQWIKPCFLELGGKNPTIVMPTADLEKAVEGVYKSAWGLQNQKCSACSRVYLHEDIADEFIAQLIAKTRDIVMGDPTQQGVYMGPVINAKAVATWERVVEQARQEGEILYGGARPEGEAYAKGHFVTPTIAKAPMSSDLFKEEFFVPFLAVAVIKDLDEALREANDVEYGLTAGFFSGEEAEVERFLNEIEAGVLYVNKRTGATTGAWPGAQSFTGWKGSGGSGKGGCGPYYVSQFMREQNRTVIRD
ncbi:aldehyde dehydrogenase family protein [Myxococcota bacterium]|nr:aldehyde dehydrogenase family protein [Myxococcota bacterium]MBU1429055.1 aldehyde dehydrogenase family protein [Myxococcota bacterium]MBU1899440.1 aldehyde dehydrogenase family protein [Myxococcota bacterium]